MAAKTRTLYHATAFENKDSIMLNGLQLRNPEQLIYLCETPFDCLKFAAIHFQTHVLVVEVKVPESWVIESFDHSEQFFKCRCFASTKPISTTKITDWLEYKAKTDEEEEG